ncbi:MAG: AI-2E family transporter [Pseudomonadota bacterium]
MEQPDAAPPRATLIARLALAALLALLGLWIAHNFLAALAWAVVIAVAIDPLHERLRRRWPGPRGRTWTAAAITLLVALVVIVPVAAGITQAAREAQEVSTWISQAQANGLPVPDWVGQLPVGREMATNWWQMNLATPEGAANQFHHLRAAADTRLIGSNVIRRVVVFAFTLLTLFFLLRDRDSIIAQLRRAGDRLFGPAGERIGLQTLRSIRGTIDGLVLVGIGEGAVMAIVYLFLGVPHPLLLGAVTAVAAMIPFGAALVFAIAAALLVGLGSVGAAIAVIVIGLVVVGIADHFIRPALIGGSTRLPFLWVLIGILGGVETLGLLGLFIGPATMAVLVMLWREYLEHQGQEAPVDGTPG